MNIIQTLAKELNAHSLQIEAAIRLLDEGATVPFIARYRKEVTGGLDDTQLRQLEERLGYLRELEERRAVVLATIEEQGKLTAELKSAILAADTRTRLEDLYRPYMVKRRTKAQIAREAGLEPLADALLSNPALDPAATAEAYINPDHAIADSSAALEGARQILMERFAEDAELVGKLRELVWDRAELVSQVVAGKESEGAKFSDYFDHRELLKGVPSHRALALLRGRKEGILNLLLELPEDRDLPAGSQGLAERVIAAHYTIREEGRAADRWLRDTVRWAWRVKLFTHLDTELKSRVREGAEEEAIRVFARNLHDLLLAAPAGQRPTMGLDPGLRTGVKVAVVDATGKLVETATIYPHVPQNQWDQSLLTLAQLVLRHKVELIAIGNGTASRETDRLAAELIKRLQRPNLTRVVVSEAGASVYSASELAAREFPELDVSLRGAVSIARRLQDPLAELVKIDPKSIGVGQYQHDVSQLHLARSLDAVVEDCVNAVGVDVNTASAALLARVSGLTATTASNIVAFRDANGAFAERRSLLKVPRLGEKTFEQCAGFLRIVGGKNPLDASAVHPEAYPVVERILQRTGKAISDIVGNSALLSRLAANEFVDERFGEPTIRDILRELEKPGRDPRPGFKTATFRDGIEELKDLTAGMILEGTVTNVTNFGAFVDIGVHQDGLVHISMLSERYISDPHAVVKAGDVVKVKVMEVDLPRKRIALTMRMSDDPRPKVEREGRNERQPAHPRGARAASAMATPPPKSGAMANAFAKLKR
jgi:protein Tex